jgi:urease accessory protein
MLTVSKCLPTGRGLAPVLLQRAPSVQLDWDVRQKSRFDATDSSGRRLGVFLPRGKVVRGGDVLVAEDGSMIRVEAAPQPVLEVRACAQHGSAFDLMRAAYHLGNRHVQLELRPDCLRLEPDHVLADMLRAMHLDVAERQAPFEPEAGAYSMGSTGGHGGHGHAPAHDHGPAHGHAQAAQDGRPGAAAPCAHGAGHAHAHDHGHLHGQGHGHHHSHGACGHAHPEPAPAPASASASAPSASCNHDHGHGLGPGHSHVYSHAHSHGLHPHPEPGPAHDQEPDVPGPGHHHGHAHGPAGACTHERPQDNGPAQAIQPAPRPGLPDIPPTR